MGHAPVGGGWRIADVVLVGSGRVPGARRGGLARARKPVERPDARKEVWSTAAPRLGAIVVLVFAAGVIALRIPRRSGLSCYLTAAAPIALFTVDAALAVHRTVSEPWVSASPVRPGTLARLRAAGDLRRAGGSRRRSARLLGQGAFGAEARRVPSSTRSGSWRASTARRRTRAPSSSRSLAEAAAGARGGAGARVSRRGGGNFGAAEPRLVRYIAAAGPDPESLSLTVRRPDQPRNRAPTPWPRSPARRELVGEEWRSDEIEARVRARAATAPAASAALRAMEGRGTKVDRADPARRPGLHADRDGSGLGRVHQRAGPADSNRRRRRPGVSLRAPSPSSFAGLLPP